MSALTLSFLAEKGGTGKSTLAISLAGALTEEQGKRVLIIDTDAQASASKFFLGATAVQQLPLHQTVASLFATHQDPDVSQVVQPTECERIWLAPASSHLRQYNEPLPQEAGLMQQGIARLVQQISNEFDAILIDTPPSIGCLPAWSAVLASDFIIAPVRPDSFSLEAIAGVQQLMLEAKQCGNKALQFLGYVVNMRDNRKSLHRICDETLRDLYQHQVFTTAIPDLVAFSESISVKKPITTSAPRSKAANAIRALATELRDRIAETQRQAA